MGRALMMGRRSEPVAASLGISTAHFKLASFAVYAGLCGVAGSVYQMLNGPISTETFDIGISITVLLMVVLGGEASVSGPLLGALALTLIPLLLNQTVSHGGSVREIVYGVVLLGVVLIVPGGLAQIGDRLKGLLARLTRHRPKDADPAEDTRGRVDTAQFEAVVTRVADPVDLELKAVSKAIGGLRILVDTSFRVEGGTIHGLIGPNGSGKTTLLNCASGLIKVNGGRDPARRRAAPRRGQPPRPGRDRPHLPDGAAVGGRLGERQPAGRRGRPPEGQLLLLRAAAPPRHGRGAPEPRGGGPLGVGPRARPPAATTRSPH